MTDRNREDPLHRDRSRSRTKYLRRLGTFMVMWLTVAFPVAMIHLFSIGFQDTEDGTAITVTQALGAAAANPLGPWAGHAVRLTQFPNAGLRLFNMSYALGLTLVFVILVASGTYANRRPIRWPIVVLFALFLPVWYGCGFMLIADGLM